MSAPRRTASVPILAYHEVSDAVLPTFRKYVVTPAEFERQMAWLHRHRYTAIDLDTLLAARRDTAVLPPRPIVLTFDDGYLDCIRNVVPVLARYGFTATFFVVADLVGTSTRWLPGERGVELALADWSALRDLATRGHTCGSHSCTHPRLTAVGADDCRDELVRSKRSLEDRLDRAVEHFAYPYGRWDDAVRRATDAAGYRSACTMDIGRSGPSEGFHSLRRVPVNGGETLSDFAWRVRTARRPRDVAAGARRLLGS